MGSKVWEFRGVDEEARIVVDLENREMLSSPDAGSRGAEILRRLLFRGLQVGREGANALAEEHVKENHPRREEGALWTSRT
jgi:hypothetical protein